MAASSKVPRSSFQRALIRRSFSVVRREHFYKDMSKFIEAGITPYNAMERMRDVSKNRRSMRWMVTLLSIVLGKMKEGAGLATSISPWVPAEEAALMHAGEKGSDLAEAMRVLSEMLGNRRKVNSSLRSNLIPSLAMMVVMVLLMVYILNTVLKEAKKLVPDEMMSKLTLAPWYFTLGEGFLTLLPYLVVVGIVAFIAISASLNRWRPNNFRRWLDQHVPPYNMFTRVQSSFFLITAASMMEAGAPFQQAVDDIHKHAAPWTKTHAKRILGKLAVGKSESDAMQTGMLPWDVEDRLAIYKMLDDFKYIMQVTARDSMEILLKKVDLLGAAIKLVVMVMLAGFIIFTIFSIGEIALEAQSSINTIRAN